MLPLSALVGRVTPAIPVDTDSQSRLTCTLVYVVLSIAPLSILRTPYSVTVSLFTTVYAKAFRTLFLVRWNVVQILYSLAFRIVRPFPFKFTKVKGRKEGEEGQ